MPDNLGTISEKEIDDFVDKLIEKKKLESLSLNNPKKNYKNNQKNTIMFSSKNENKKSTQINPFLYQLENSKIKALNETGVNKTQEATILSLRPSTENLLKILQRQARMPYI